MADENTTSNEISDPSALETLDSKDAQNDEAASELEYGDRLASTKPKQVDASVIDESVDTQSKTEEKAELAKLADINDLSETERKQVDQLIDKIDLSDCTAILSYGLGAQKKDADFSQNVLDNVRSKDLGEIGNELSTLVVTLGDLNVDKEDQGGFLGLFKKTKNKVESLKARYAKVETNVRDISKQLEAHQRTLLKDIDMLDKMYELNQNYYKELSMYVVAGKEKLDQVRSKELVQAQKKAEDTGMPEDVQIAREIASACESFEKRVYDLELTRQVALQSAPQIRMVQAGDRVMAEKIQTTIVNTIPLWKNQMVIALGTEHATQAAAAQRQVSEMTNELLKKNADALHTATIEAAQESERGIIDIETLRHTNEKLISTLDEVMQIQHEGREKRREAEVELAQIEDQLKQKLLEASRTLS